VGVAGTQLSRVLDPPHALVPVVTWERVHMAYQSTCDTCAGVVKKRAHAYLFGSRLLCGDCFTATPEGRRVKRAQRARRRPMTKAEARYTIGRSNQN
jgi:hypothetical protein